MALEVSGYRSIRVASTYQRLPALVVVEQGVGLHPQQQFFLGRELWLPEAGTSDSHIGAVRCGDARYCYSGSYLS